MAISQWVTTLLSGGRVGKAIIGLLLVTQAAKFVSGIMSNPIAPIFFFSSQTDHLYFTMHIPLLNVGKICLINIFVFGVKGKFNEALI